MKKNTSIIRPCVCDHKSQDEMHGKAPGRTGYRCTVCGRVHEDGSAGL